MEGPQLTQPVGLGLAVAAAVVVAADGVWRLSPCRGSSLRGLVPPAGATQSRPVSSQYPALQPVRPRRLFFTVSLSTRA